MGGSMTASRRPDGAPAGLRRRRWIYDGLTLVLALAAIVPATRLLDLPPFIERITVMNPTVYDIGIEVTGRDRDGWVAVGTARRESTSVFEAILDQGDVWIFRFSAQGRDGGELRVPRHQLEADAWTVAIPEEVGRKLAEQGAPPPP